MDNRVVRVPVSLLLDSGQTASAKVVWMVRHLYPTASPSELAARAGVGRHTVQRGVRKLKPNRRPRGGPWAKLPAALLADPDVGPNAKVLYGLLQAAPCGRGMRGQFTYASLCECTHLGRNTLKRAISELVAAHWVQVTQKSRVSPIHFALGSPAFRRSLAEAAEAGRRLKRAQYTGEALMQEYLSLLIDSDEFTDNARPGFLVNPLTQERLELDRFYPPSVAFEFHGNQHFGQTDRFTQEEADAQHLRDLIKAGICLYRGIHLVIVRAEDLTLQRMIAKVGQHLPVRDLAGHEPVIDRLEEASLTYRAAAT